MAEGAPRRTSTRRELFVILMCIIFLLLAALFTLLSRGSTDRAIERAHIRTTEDCKRKPIHVIHIVADDLGWDDVSWSRTFEDEAMEHGKLASQTGSKKHPHPGVWRRRLAGEGSPDNSSPLSGRTPNLDELRKSGVLLSRFYTPKDCAPSRASMLTGRWPFRVGYYSNPGDDGGLPVHFKTLPEMLSERYGYECHHVGKWHLGFSSLSMVPTHRGFQTSVGFFHWGKDYSSHLFPPKYAVNRNQGCQGYDLYNASIDTGVFPIGEQMKGVSTYEIFTTEAKRRINTHNPRNPLYLLLATQHVHDPYGYESTTLTDRRSTYKTLVQELDDMVGQVVQTLKARRMWERTLLIFHSDNGGELVFPSDCKKQSVDGRPLPFTGGAASNFPLRGGKFTLWEGGIRNVALLSGGYVPRSRRNSVYDKPTHVVDLWGSLEVICGRWEHQHRVFRCRENNRHSHLYTARHVDEDEDLDTTTAIANALTPLHTNNSYILDGLTERAEILLHPMNRYANGSCTSADLSNRFRPSCASGLIAWPYKLLVGYPGDSRYVSWHGKQGVKCKDDVDGLLPTSSSMTSSSSSLTSFASSLFNQATDSSEKRHGELCHPDRPCLFDLSSDPNEAHNLNLGSSSKSRQHHTSGSLQEYLQSLSASNHSPDYPLLAKLMLERLYQLSLETVDDGDGNYDTPIPVSVRNDGDAFPAEACEVVTETGTWLPYKGQQPQQQADEPTLDIWRK